MMEEPTSPSVQLVLSIKEGRGFQQVWQSTSIVATLNGHCLETDLIEPNANPQYEIDLVWEIEKSKLRKIRSGLAPLKMECFAHKSNEMKEKIGYLLLNVRSAQIISKHTGCEAKFIWHKLLGLRNDLKVDKPELHLSLSIYEQESNITQELKQTQDNHQLSQSDQLSPVLLSDLRLIQLGPLNVCQELFLLSVTAISATNMGCLVSKENSAGTKAELNFLCKILENDVYFKPFPGDCNSKILLNEKIVVRIRSSLMVLKEYLTRHPYLSMFLKHKDIFVGQSEVDLSQLLFINANPEFNKNEFSESSKNYRCYFHEIEITNDSIEPDFKKSYIDLQLRLQYLGMKPDLITDASSPVLHSGMESSLNARNNEVPNEIHSHRNAAGDFATSTHGTYSPYLPNANFIGGITNIQLSDQQNGGHNSNGLKTYNCYYLNIGLNTMKTLFSKYAEANIEIWLHHPKSGVASKFYQRMPRMSETLKLQDVVCKLHFISSADEIKNLLVTYPPKISIHESVDNKSCISQFGIDVKKLFYQNKQECQYTMTICNMQQTNFAELNISLSLENQGPYCAINKNAATENLGPPILDESLVYKIVDELETWKDKQKEIFKYELKKKEERHLNLLGLEWQKQKESLEAKLACSVEQCKMLASSLNNATEDLRTRRLKSLEKEARLIKANEDLQWRYESKVQELKDSLNSIQEELTSKVNTLEAQNAKLGAQVEPLTIDNERLRTIVKNQSEELETFQKGSLTQDQTTNLLQELKALEEKLQDVTHRKSFFKEQWCKAVREIHRMKMETQQAMQLQIKNSKKELQNLDLEEILQADSAELATDRIMLQGIQRQIDDMTPKPSFSTNYCQTHSFPSGTTIDTLVPPNTSKSTFRIPEANEGRLQNLIEERDSLLNTGSYTSDDALIVKLNAEIRSLMK